MPRRLLLLLACLLPPVLGVAAWSFAPWRLEVNAEVAQPPVVTAIEITSDEPVFAPVPVAVVAPPLVTPAIPTTGSEDDEYADLDQPPAPVISGEEGVPIIHAYPDELSLQYAGANGAHRMKEALKIVPSITITPEKLKIAAGGKDNQTDKTTVKIKVAGGYSHNATIALLDGLGTQFTQQQTVGAQVIEAGGDHPSRFVGSGLTLTAGNHANSAAMTMQSGVEYEFTLYSSNLVGDTARVRVALSDTTATSIPIGFDATSIEYVFKDHTGAVVSPETLVPYQSYGITTKMTYKGVAVTGHDVLLLPKDVTDNGGQVYSLDANADNNVDDSEKSMFRHVVDLGLWGTMTNDENGNTERVTSIKFGGLSNIHFVALDTTIFSTGN